MGLQVKITAKGSEKIMNVKMTSKWLEVDDPNNNGYYKVRWIGKVALIQLLSYTPEFAARNIEAPADGDILASGLQDGNNCILQMKGWSTAYALCEVLQATP